LAERAAHGDRDAFAALYRLHHLEVFRFVRARVRNSAVAEDLTSDVFVRAWTGVSRFVWNGGGFGAWLATIARNRVVDWHKSAEVSRTSAYAEVPERRDDDRFADPADAVPASMEAAELHAAILTLTPAQADAVLYRYIDDLSVRETGERLGLQDGAVKALCYRATANLRRVMANA
jgi:RNA polymerase sigma-70 factor (ECF subfamily)